MTPHQYTLYMDNLYAFARLKTKAISEEMENARGESTESLSHYVTSQNEMNALTRGYRFFFGEPIKIIARRKLFEERLSSAP
ncbi:hypothetical protein HY449_03565 [Candidatus Pacearchaeota archaeon]|nr:hypothetical protein [Candidatus Pacearchaeota archaeon]